MALLHPCRLGVASEGNDTKSDTGKQVERNLLGIFVRPRNVEVLPACSSVHFPSKPKIPDPKWPWGKTKGIFVVVVDSKVIARLPKKA